LLTASNRLTSASDFRTAVRSGRRAGGRLLVVHWSVIDDTRPTRVGFVVSKAVGTAVVRNRVKRRLRHLARERVSSLPGSGLLVVRALPAAADASYAELAAELDRGLARSLKGTAGDEGASVVAQ
jgi:ribonuclease P protein component